MDGLKIGNTFVAGGDRTNMSLSPLLFEEVDVQVSGQGADAPTIGVQLNAIPRSGSKYFPWDRACEWVGPTRCRRK